MAVVLLKTCFVNGSLTEAGQTVSMDAATEAYFVQQQLATYVTAPYQGGSTSAARYHKDATGNVDGFLDQDGSEYLAWDDVRFPVQGINPAGAASPPTLDDTTIPGTFTFSGTTENVIAGVAQMPHAWKPGTSIHPHVHWAKTTSASGGVVWEFSYAIANNGDTLGAYSDWTAGTSELPDSNTANKVAIDSFGSIDMTGKRESCLVLWKVRRNPGATADTYAAAARLFEFDIHYRVQKHGTVIEYPGGPEA